MRTFLDPEYAKVMIPKVEAAFGMPMEEIECQYEDFINHEVNQRKETSTTIYNKFIKSIGKQEFEENEDSKLWVNSLQWYLFECFSDPAP